MSEGRTTLIWKWIARIVDLLSLIPAQIRDFIPSTVGVAVIGLFKWLGGVPLLEALGIGVGVAILLGLPVLLRYLSPSTPLESASSVSGSSALRTTLGVGQIVALLFVVFFAYSLYVQLQLQEIHRELGYYVYPRRLTSHQKADIVAYLKIHEPYDITLLSPANDEEASLYASDFSESFTAGNWRVRHEGATPDNPVPTQRFLRPGVSLEHSSNAETQREYSGRRPHDPPHPGKVASDAIQAVVGGYGYSLDQTLADGVHRIVLTVGPRPYSLQEERRKK